MTDKGDNIMNKTTISQDSFETITAAFKVLHSQVLNHLVSTKADTSEIPSDFNKCGFDHYKKVGLLARGMLNDKLEADKLARLLPFTAAIATASETYIEAARTAWSQASALPAETRALLGIKAPVSVKVPVSAFAKAWNTPTDMARDLNEMKVQVVKSDKGDYISVPFPTESATVAKAA